jgi:hypothetical protein
VFVLQVTPGTQPVAPDAAEEAELIPEQGLMIAAEAITTTNGTPRVSRFFDILIQIYLF